MEKMWKDGEEEEGGGRERDCLMLYLIETAALSISLQHISEQMQ